MTHEVEMLTEVFRWALFIAAFFTTLFVVMYFFCPWWVTPVGKVLMFRSIAMSLALDINVFFVFWTPSVVKILWIEIFVLTLIAIANLLMTFWLYRVNKGNQWFRRSNKISSSHD